MATKKATKSKVNAAGVYTNPSMRKTIFERIKAGKAPKMAKGGTAKSCWPGYEKKGIKKMYGKTYNNCVKK